MEWKPIETAPKDGSSFLAVTKCNKMLVANYGHTGILFISHIGAESWNEDNLPTHWMPLPKPPAIIIRSKICIL